MKRNTAMKNIGGGLMILALVFALLWSLDVFPLEILAPTEDEGARLLIPADSRQNFSTEEILQPGEEGALQPVGEGVWEEEDVTGEEGTYRGDRPMVLVIARDEGLFQEQREPVENLEPLLGGDVLLGSLLITVEDIDVNGERDQLLTLLIDSRGRIAKRYKGPIGEEGLLQGITLLLEEEQ